MRFAVVGDQASVAPFVRAIAARPGFQIVAVPPSHAKEAGRRTQLPDVPAVRNWEELLADSRLQFVIVADDDDETLVAARQLAAAGKGLLVAPIVARAATFVYELGLQHAEQPFPLIPILSRRGHPLVRKLHSLLESGQLGRIQYLQVAAQIVPQSATAGANRLSKDDVARAFLADLDLLVALGGQFDQVTAMRSGDDEAGIALESIRLSGAGLPQAIWTATPGVETTWQMQVAFDQGTATLSKNAEAGPFQLRIAAPDGTITEETDTFDPGAAQLDAICARGESVPAALVEYPATVGIPTEPGWEDFTRSAELFEAVERSIRRRRTIEIHFESPSERGQFKTYMTAAGCSLLTLTLFAVIAYLTATSLIELPPFVKKTLVGLIFLPLGLFLALQVLILLARPTGRIKDPG